MFPGNAARVVREGGGFLRVDRGVGRTGLEPVTLCLKAPVSAIVSDAGGAPGREAIRWRRVMLPDPPGQL
jgi:hypothetical protein